MYSSARHEIEMSDEFQVQAALPPWKEVSIPVV
jgi:hypothetical protein